MSLSGEAESSEIFGVSSFFLKFILLFYMGRCFTCIYVYVPHTCLVLKEAAGGHQMPLDLELQVVVGYQVGAGN